MLANKKLGFSMPTQRLVHAIPVAVQPKARLKFARASLHSGVSIRKAEGPLARKVAERSKTLPVAPGFVPTHLIVIDQNAYFEGLDERLLAAGATRDKGEHSHVDLDGLKRQVLIAITLRGRCVWEVGDHHTFDYSDPDFPYSSAGYSHHDTQRVSSLLRYSAPDGWFVDVRSGELRAACNQLDCYYRSGTWWVDRLSVALGYLWSGLTTSHPELSFLALCMALEAIGSTSHNEISHILAERCAVLTEASGKNRLLMYDEVKDLYALRSKIVHGRSTPRRGPMNWETLAITAKQSLVPRSARFRMLAVTIRVINAVLGKSELLDILHVRRSEEKASEALNEYFQSSLLQR